MSTKYEINETPISMPTGSKGVYLSSRTGCFKVSIGETLDKDSFHFDSKYSILGGQTIWIWSDHGKNIVDVSELA